MSKHRRELMRSCLRAATGGALLAAAICGPSAAHEYEVGKIKVEHPWLRSPSEGGTSAPLFMIIENDGDTPDKLVGVKADTVGKVVVHADPSQIIVPHGIVIPPHATVTLEPGGPHIGLHDVKKMNPVGWGFELTLIFEKAGDLTIDAAVEAPDAKHAHDAEAMERWEKANAPQKNAEAAGRDEPHHETHDDSHHDDHQHMHEEHEHMSEEAPDVGGMDHSKLNHGVLGHAPPDGR
jgi:hypothetical protein